MAVVDRLETIFSLRDNYTSGANKATAATKRLADAQRIAATTNKSFQGSISGLGASMSSSFAAISAGAAKIGGAITAIAAVPAAFAAAEIALFSLAKGVSTKAAEFDALEKSLIAVEGGSKAAGIEMKRLLAIAQGPGLGQQETIAGYAQLRNAGLTQQLAERLIRELGNANARAGGGPQQLAGILRQISQAASKPYLQGEELSTLTENGIPAYKIVKDALGTSDTAELKAKGITSVQVLEAIAASLEKTERVAGGTKNSFDNLMDTISMAQVSIGRGVNETWGPFADELNSVIAAADKGGVFTELGRSITEALSMDDVTTKEALINILAFAKTGVEWFGYLKEAILMAMGPIGQLIGLVWKTSPMHNIAVGSFDANRDLIRSQIEGGEAANEIEKRKAEKARQNELAIADAAKGQYVAPLKGMGPLKPGQEYADFTKTTPAEPVVNALQDAFDENRRALDRNTSVHERVIDLTKQINGGGGFADSATSELAIQRATHKFKGGSGLDPNLAMVLHYLQAYGAGQMAAAYESMRKMGSQSGNW